MAHTVKEAVHVSMFVDGKDVSLDLSAGEHDLAPAVAALLVEQNLATEVSASKKAAKSTPTDESLEA
jgi:hypothetical protein